jgi:hypothetical protein
MRAQLISPYALKMANNDHMLAQMLKKEGAHSPLEKFSAVAVCPIRSPHFTPLRLSSLCSGLGTRDREFPCQNGKKGDLSWTFSKTILIGDLSTLTYHRPCVSTVSYHVYQPLSNHQKWPPREPLLLQIGLARSCWSQPRPGGAKGTNQEQE